MFSDKLKKKEDNKKKFAIFGAGQVGSMLAKLLHSQFKPICFIDNSEKKQDTSISNVPVLSIKDALKLSPDYILLGVVDHSRMVQMENQLTMAGYEGEIIRADILKLFDFRLALLRLYSEQPEVRNLAGDIAELGVYQGEFAAELNKAFPNKNLHLFDTFEGFSESDIKLEKQHKLSQAQIGDFNNTDYQTVLKKMPFPEKVKIYQGVFPETFANCEAESFSFISLDADLYSPTKHGLLMFWPKLVYKGGILVHDYNSFQYKGVKKAVDEFLTTKKKSGVKDYIKIPLSDIHGSLLIIKIEK